MKVVLVPGPRNEELIAEILRNKAMLNEEDWRGYVYDLVADHKEDNFDALYYACEDGDAILIYYPQCGIHFFLF